MPSEQEEYVVIARASTPHGELILRERAAEDDGSALELRVNGIFVMDTEETSTERALARQTLELVSDPREVLVGGLGLGYTLHEVLADPRVRRCTVVELEPTLVEWMSDGTISHGPGMLADPRLRIVVADVAQVIRAAGEASYDLILLDVDNGPDHLVHEQNAALYDAPALAAAHDILRVGGALVVWSAEESPALIDELLGVFGNAEGRGHDVRLQDRDEHYWLHIARRLGEVHPAPGRMVDPAATRAQYADESRLETRRSVWQPGDDGRDPVEVALLLARSAAGRGVLEVGCGPGRFAARFRELCPEVAYTAIDTSERFIELCRERGVDARVADAMDLPFPDGKFDLVVANWMLYHVPDLDRGLAEIRRVLSPRGRLLAVTNGDEHVAHLRREAGGGPVLTAFSSENGETTLLRHFDRVSRQDIATPRGVRGSRGHTGLPRLQRRGPGAATVRGTAGVRRPHDRVPRALTTHPWATG